MSMEEVLQNIVDRYRYSGLPVEVNFRDLTPIRAGEDRLTHLMHSYPAKLLPSIPAFFLSSREITPENALVYDPFCGTGTVLVEAIASGKRAAGADANPLARLISKVKTTSIEREILTHSLDNILRYAPQATPQDFSPVVSVDKWFTEESRNRIGRIRSAIEESTASEVQDFFHLCLSQIIKRCSLADPRMSVPVRIKDEYVPTLDPLDIFERTCKQNITRIQTLPADAHPEVIAADARIPLTKSLGNGKQADVIITSPPYAGAQKYIRASSLSLGWLGLAPEAKLRKLEILNIGREHITASERLTVHPELPRGVQLDLQRIREINPTRAGIFATYMKEMSDAVTAVTRSLRTGGYLVLVMGDNEICGSPVRTSAHIRDLFVGNGFELLAEMVDHIKSRGLMTKRNKTAGVISHEHVFLMKKVSK